MDWKYLLTSYEGRINRAKFWACVGVIFAGAIIAIIIDNIIGTTFNSMPYGFVYLVVCDRHALFGLRRLRQALA